ncbi:hypothetical protein [Flavobacterium sp. MDT1-60]|uniref:hypothetical protein n=1 Tax=Flavobacterium sp. MDT1-60 TaxID=1979344 RepID=UPI00177AF261|nr:hypothetical protein [Flavobacterium sp. MDT1-60]QOG01663.1 hypothetical protein IHE43_17910 [Flavobacterium sp. MDT1-60]
MKKKFTLEIANPCTENFDKMIPNSKGSFCDSCAKNVIDLSKKTNTEVARFIAENKGKNICARLKTTQLGDEFEYNETSKINNFKYAAIAASVLLTSNVIGQEKTPVETEISVQKSTNHIVGKIAFNPQPEEEISITVKGKLIDAKTNKPLDHKKYPNLTLTINNSRTPIKINGKTGDFSIPITVLKSTKSLILTIESSDYYLSKTIPFDVKLVKENVFLQDISIDIEQGTKVYMLGGLGINYIDRRGIKEI